MVFICRRHIGLKRHENFMSTPPTDRSCHLPFTWLNEPWHDSWISLFFDPYILTNRTITAPGHTRSKVRLDALNVERAVTRCWFNNHKSPQLGENGCYMSYFIKHIQDISYTISSCYASTIRKGRVHVPLQKCYNYYTTHATYITHQISRPPHRAVSPSGLRFNIRTVF